jgi:hypothetical protein
VSQGYTKVMMGETTDTATSAAGSVRITMATSPWPHPLQKGAVLEDQTRWMRVVSA